MPEPNIIGKVAEDLFLCSSSFESSSPATLPLPSELIDIAMNLLPDCEPSFVGGNGLKYYISELINLSEDFKVDMSKGPPFYLLASLH